VINDWINGYMKKTRFSSRAGSTKAIETHWSLVPMNNRFELAVWVFTPDPPPMNKLPPEKGRPGACPSDGY
jgi:hypothetical protein